MDDPAGIADRQPEARPRRRASLTVALVLLLVVGGALAWGASYYQRCRSAPDDGPVVTFEVPEGASGQDVVAALAEAGLTNCDGFVGNLLLRGTGKANDIIAGTYELTPGMTLDEIVTVLTTPPREVVTLELALQEGLQIDSPVGGREDIASHVEEDLQLSAKRFRQLVESGRYGIPGILREGRSLEGFLFPAIYELRRRDLDEDAVIRALLDRFAQEAEALDLVRGAKRLGLTPYEVVVIASMIEREYQDPSEGPLIAGVIYNRLRDGIPLGIDATLLYDDPTPDGELSTGDIETDGPYNTRIRAGLPPTPIASPGGRGGALEWALNPQETTFLYYVLCPPDGEGVHRFAETLAEHERNVAACLG
jgi:UPF0755 protein